MGLRRLFHMLPDFGDNRSSKCDIRHEVAIPVSSDHVRMPIAEELKLKLIWGKMRGDLHDVDMEPVGALLHCAGTVSPQLGKICRENGRCNDCVGSHFC
jgi:hypothetical protein